MRERAKTPLVRASTIRSFPFSDWKCPLFDSIARVFPLETAEIATTLPEPFTACCEAAQAKGRGSIVDVFVGMHCFTP